MPSLVAPLSIAVSRLAAARVFFESLLTVLGYEVDSEAETAGGPQRWVAVSRNQGVLLTIAATMPAETDGPQHLVLAADTRLRVDEVAVLAEWLGAPILDGPRLDDRNRYRLRIGGPDRLTLDVVHAPAICSGKRWATDLRRRHACGSATTPRP